MAAYALVGSCFTACGERRQTRPQGDLWRLARGGLVGAAELGAFSTEPILTRDMNHLVVRLPVRSPCGERWVKSDCTPWASASLLHCAGKWQSALEGEVIAEGRIFGDRASQVVIVDALGEEHPASVERDGRFRVSLREGGGPEPPVRIQLLPFHSSTDRVNLLWLHAAAIDARVTGAVLKQAGPVWFVTSIQPGSPAAHSELQAGDEVVSVNGRRLEDAGPEVLGEAFELDPARLRIEYSRCEAKGNVTLPRVPRGVLWTSEADCPCVTGACPPDRSAPRAPVAEAPRRCGD